MTISLAKAQHQVQGRLLLDVVISQRAAVLELLAGKDLLLATLARAGLVRLGFRNGFCLGAASHFC